MSFVTNVCVVCTEDSTHTQSLTATVDTTTTIATVEVKIVRKYTMKNYSIK